MRPSSALGFLAVAGVATVVVTIGLRAQRPGRRAAKPLPPVETADPSGYPWRLPPGFPRPRVPRENPMSAAKVELGRHLFFEPRLSKDGKTACSSCHEPALAFTDGKGQAHEAGGEIHPRGAMSLANVAYSPVLNWANPSLRRLETQALIPLFGEEPVEMGMAGLEKVMLERLRAEPRYGPLFAQAYPGEPAPVSLGNVTKALACFERTLLSGSSPYDRYRSGAEPGAISPQARRGEELFFGERLECFHCHGGFTFTQTADHEGKGFAEIEFHNTGLYNLDEHGRYPAPNTGVHAITGRAEDMGRFKAPTLRNIELTAPYMHDGSIPTLDGVLDHYAAGGRTLADGPHRGVGALNPNRSSFVKGFVLTPEERGDLLAFLRSLTDPGFVADPRFQDPWKGPAGEGTRHAIRPAARP